MADEHDRAGEGAQEIGDARGVTGQAAQRVGNRPDHVSVALQAVDLPAPTGGVGPGTMHEDNGRFHTAAGRGGGGGTPRSRDGR